MQIKITLFNTKFPLTTAITTYNSSPHKRLTPSKRTQKFKSIYVQVLLNEIHDFRTIQKSISQGCCSFAVVPYSLNEKEKRRKRVENQKEGTSKVERSKQHFKFSLSTSRLILTPSLIIPLLHNTNKRSHNSPISMNKT